MDLIDEIDIKWNYFIVEECKKYGENGLDKFMCDSRGGIVICK